MKTKKCITILSYIYIALPVLIFFLGWMKLYLALPVCLMILYAFWKASAAEQDLWYPVWNKDTILLACIIAGIIGLWVYFSGIGGMTYQNSDHWWRNQTFQILVEYDWPVTKQVMMEDGVHTRGLIYYIGFWLPAACVGKLFGLTAGYCFQLLWAALGVGLVYYYICAYLKRLSVWPLFGLILFSGLDILGYYMIGRDLGQLTNTLHLEAWSFLFQYSGMTTQLFWVFNQSIYAWILTALLMHQKNNRHIILILSCGLLECTLPFVGMLPFALYKIWKNGFESSLPIKAQWKSWFFGLFTIENVLAGGCIGIISYLYLMGNTAAQTIISMPEKITKGYIFLYLIFFIIEVGFYFLSIYRYQKNDSLYWITVLVLFVCPLIRVGSGIDFCMRASIPALFVLYLLVMRTWQTSFRARDFAVAGTIAGLFLIGSVNSLHELNRTATETIRLYEAREYIMAEPVPEDDILGAENFSGDVDKNIFYKYLAR